jgi:hypothetical protein
MEQKTTQILITASNLWDTKRLGLDEECREIKKILHVSGYEIDFDLEYPPAANIDDLSQQLLNIAQHIMHFSGYGELQGLYLQNESGNAQLVRKEVFVGQIFNGRDVDFSFELGKNTIETANFAGWQTPQLILDAVSFADFINCHPLIYPDSSDFIFRNCARAQYKKRSQIPTPALS